MNEYSDDPHENMNEKIREGCAERKEENEENRVVDRLIMDPMDPSLAPWYA